jgi:NADH-quinone oxidoreductase subunit M
MPTTILLFSLKFFEQYPFLRSSESLFQVLSFLGVLMVVVGGFFTAVQTNIQRAFGFSMLTETGFSLLALSMIADGGLNWMLMILPPRAISALLWAHSIALVKHNSGAMEIKDLKGFARHYPILSLGLIIGQLSLAGLPLLGSFPVKSLILTAAFGIGNGIGAWSFMGSLGLFLFSIRLLAALVTPSDLNQPERWMRYEKSFEYLPILIMILVLMILGLFPNAFLDGITQTLLTFSQLQ